VIPLDSSDHGGSSRERHGGGIRAYGELRRLARGAMRRRSMRRGNRGGLGKGTTSHFCFIFCRNLDFLIELTPGTQSMSASYCVVLSVSLSIRC
jgi:hypothetical protein